MVLKVHREESCQTAHCGDAVGVSVPWLASQRTDGDDIIYIKNMCLVYLSMTKTAYTEGGESRLFTIYSDLFFIKKSINKFGN